MKKKAKKKPVSVWQAMNEPVVEVTDGAARTIFLAAAVIFLAVWIMPYLGNAKPVAASAPQEVYAYEPLFVDYPVYSAVAGEVISFESGRSSPEWYLALAEVGSGLSELYQESFRVPFGQAASHTFDISGPVQDIAEFYGPGLAAVRDAWLELMADPQL